MKTTNRKAFWTRRKLLIVIVLMLIVVGFTVWYNEWKIATQITYTPQGMPTNEFLATCEFMKTRPESNLYYPNGKVFAPFCHSTKKTDEGIDPAFAGAVMVTNDSPEKVYAWYHDKLLAFGWHRDDHAFAGLGDTQTSLHGYFFKGRGSFYIAMDDPKQLSWTLGKKVPVNTTVFEFRYFY